MKINNKTNAVARYDISAPNQSDCGTIPPGEGRILPSYDDQPVVKVYFGFPDGGPSIEAPGDGEVAIEVTEG